MTSCHAPGTGYSQFSPLDGTNASQTYLSSFPQQYEPMPTAYASLAPFANASAGFTSNFTSLSNSSQDAVAGQHKYATTYMNEPTSYSGGANHSFHGRTHSGMSYVSQTDGSGFGTGSHPAAGFTPTAVSTPGPITSPTSNNSMSSSRSIARATCATCGKTFSRSKDLERHTKKHQSGSDTFRCRVARCSYSSYRKDKLEEHMRRPHRA